MFPTIGATPLPFARYGHDDPKVPARGAPNAASLAALAAGRTVDGRLQVTTKEGDTVTIAAHAEAGVTYADLRTRGRGVARYASLEASRELTLEVQGDLSDAERAEIEKVVKAFFHELRDAFRGRGADVGDVARAGDGAATLAGFAVHLDASTSLTAVSVVAGPRGGAQPLPVAPAPDDEATAGASAAAEAAPVPAVNVPVVVGRLLQAARGAHVPRARLAHVLNRVFDRFARTLGRADERAVLAALRSGVKQGVAQAAPPEAAPVDVPAEEAPPA